MKKHWPKLIFVLLVVGLSPLLARFGTYKEVKRWDAPAPNSFGHPHPLYLSVQQTHSIFDPFKLYTDERMVISDGGYAYVLEFNAPAHPAKAWIDKCDVIWQSDAVLFKSPSGLTIRVEKNTVLTRL